MLLLRRCILSFSGIRTKILWIETIPHCAVKLTDESHHSVLQRLLGSQQEGYTCKSISRSTVRSHYAVSHKASRSVCVVLETSVIEIAGSIPRIDLPRVSSLVVQPECEATRKAYGCRAAWCRGERRPMYRHVWILSSRRRWPIDTALYQRDDVYGRGRRPHTRAARRPTTRVQYTVRKVRRRNTL